MPLPLFLFILKSKLLTASFMKCSHQISFSIVYAHIQGSAKSCAPGLVNFYTAVAYPFCLSLPAPFTQPGACLFTEPCICQFLLLSTPYTEHSMNEVLSRSMWGVFHGALSCKKWRRERKRTTKAEAPVKFTLP